MKIYLAGFKSIAKHYKKPTKDIYLLSSFWEHKSGKYDKFVMQEKHILDSGAFTAINDKTGKYKNFDWDNYVDKYIAFIKKTKQKLFFELDIDCVVGLKKVEYYRKLIEDKIGIAPIVCWHQNRGIDYYIKCCEEYDYVALGTTPASPTGKRIRSNPAVLKQFIEIAHKNNAKIHGLGFTSSIWLDKLKFDSVDSTTWNVGGKFGNVVVLDSKGYPTQRYKQENKRVKDSNKLNIYNFEQWVRYQKWADINL
tara:strand:- start:1700 stop:2455 length:756 start_codon:yes stop_codon:yes gene_type:complete